jgi:ribose transport system substrate-binding protein
MLLSQDCYGWGTKSVDILLEKIVKNNVKNVREIDNLTRVTKDNVDEFGKNWSKWLGN